MALLNVPVLLVVNVTVPVGVIEPVPDVSAAVAVQVVVVLSNTLAGLHETTVLLPLIVDATVKVPELPVWLESPP